MAGLLLVGLLGAGRCSAAANKRDAHLTAPSFAIILLYCRYREAMYSFQAAVRVQAADPLAHFRIGNTLFALKKYPEARKASKAGWGW